MASFISSLTFFSLVQYAYSQSHTSWLSRCPSSCGIAGSDPANWTYFHVVADLEVCNQTTLLELNIYNDVADDTSDTVFRACTTLPSSTVLARAVRKLSSLADIGKRQFLAFNATFAGIQTSKDALNLVSSISGEGKMSGPSAHSTQALADYLNELAQNDESSPGPINLLARAQGIIAGVYIGSRVDVASVVSVVEKFGQSEFSSFSHTVLSRCKDNSSSPEVFGLVIDTRDDLSAVQKSLKALNNAECPTGEQSQEWTEAPIKLRSGTSLSVKPHTDSSDSALTRRDSCKYTQAQAGDGCYALAQRCGVTQDQLSQYNGGGNFCSNLKVGQYVCCSSGSPPDFSPQPNSDGSCFTYTIQSGDTCSALAEKYQTTVDKISDANGDTWGFAGCNGILIGQVICLSSGSPPMPAPVENAVCGPQVNGTKKPADMSTLPSLNPCPIRACCDKWGQCGITSDFCTAARSDTGAPGTSPPGTNGCISNCGTDIVNNGQPPASFMRVGYYEAFNLGRPCLHMYPSDIDTDHYTHVHFAFGNISTSYDVDMSDAQELFDDFKKLNGVKKIVSFGGWAFSTSPSTAPIFREGVTDDQRQTFATKVANFVVDNDLDGVDFDWEYPGAPDIPGIPPGSPDDGKNYLAFLRLVRAALPSGKTISIAAPASYWYLKGFPLEDMNDVFDYLIFMTYDLHGQWDYGNDFTDPGCPAGDCLRSQVNLTETRQAFSMVTKAGVQANKIVVGMALYGRSFQMTDPSCYTEMCTYTGPASGAKPGMCTDTGGYISNWEIEQIIAKNSVQQYSSEEAGDILIYDTDNWVSWMKPSTYNSRVTLIEGLNFGGTSDWAIDLNASYSGSGNNPGNTNGSGVVSISPDIFSEADPTIACYPPCTFVLPPWSLSASSTISRPPVTEVVQENYMSIYTAKGGVTSTAYFSTTTTTTITVPAITTDVIEIWNVEWTDTAQDVIYFTSSVSFPPITLTESPRVLTTGTETTRQSGIVYTYKPGPYPAVTAPTSAIASPTTTSSTTFIPPPGLIGSVHVSVGPPKPTCRPGQLCGHLCQINCSPELPCIGICDCIGLGCPSGGDCIGPGCTGGGGPGGGGSDDPDDPDKSSSSSSCTMSTTVSDCEVACSVTPGGGGSDYTTNCYTTSCYSTVTDCDIKGTTTTSETIVGCPSPAAYTPYYNSDPNQIVIIGDGENGGYIPDGYSGTYTEPTPTPSYVSCSTQNQDPDQGITEAYCVCSGSTFPQSTATDPPNSCAYTFLPASTTDIHTGATTTVSTNPSSSSPSGGGGGGSAPAPTQYTGTCNIDNAGDQPNGLCAYNDNNGDLQVVPCGPSDSDLPNNCEKSGDPCYFTEGSDEAACSNHGGEPVPIGGGGG